MNDIKGIDYKIEKKSDKIDYELIFKKLINGKLLEINYMDESTGILHYLDLIPYIYNALKGKTIIIDEFDANLHSSLSVNLLNYLYQKAKGQLILTCHDTSLLDLSSKYYDTNIRINPECFYFLEQNSDGFREIKSAVEYNVKIVEKTNLRNYYINNSFGEFSNNYYFEELFEYLMTL